MKASFSARGRSASSLFQNILIAVILLIGVGTGLVIVAFYFQLTQTIDRNLRPASNLLPQLSALRNEVALFHADTETEINKGAPDFNKLLAERDSIQNRVNTLRPVAPPTGAYANALTDVEIALTVFDNQIAILRNNPTYTQIVTAKFELQRAFLSAQASLDVLYQREEQMFYAATNDTFVSIGNVQIALIVVGFAIAGLGAGLVYNIRRSAHREARLASGRLQVAAEVGQAAASLLSLDQLFETTLNLICQRFGYAYAAVFLLDEKGEYAVLRAATGEAGRNLIASGQRAPVGSNSTIGQVTFTNRPRVYSEARRAEYVRSELIASTQSELAVPLRQGNVVIGALDVQSTESDPFSDDDIAVMQTLADQIAVAIGNAAQFTREQVRARQLVTLTQSAISLTGPQINLRSLLETVGQQACLLLSAEDAGIWLPATDSDLELRVSVKQADQIGRRLKSGEGISGQVYAGSKPLRIDDYPRWEGRSRALASAGIQTAMAVPLMWQGEPIGALTLTRTEANRPFTVDDEQIAQLFASQAAAAMENTRLLQEAQGRVNELYTLNQIGQAIAAQTDLRSLFDVVRVEVTRFISARNFYVALYDAATNMVELPYSYSNGQIETIPPYPLGQGLTSIVIQSRQPLLVHSAEEAVAQGALFSGPPAQSYLGVPVMQRDHIIAVIAVQDLEKSHAYSDSDARLLVTVGSQIGLAIQNVRLLEQTRQRVNELSVIADISHTLTSQLDLNAILTAVGDKISELFGVRDLYVALYDSRTNSLEFPYLVEDGKRRSVPVVPLGEGLSSIIIRTRQPLLINRDAIQHVRNLGAHLTGLPAKSFLGVPIVAGDLAIGVISIQDPETEGLFGGAATSLLSTIAANVGAAIENVRLFHETQRSIQDVTIVNNIGQAVIKQTDLASLAKLVTEELMRVFDVTTAYLALYDRHTNLVSLPAMYYLGKPLETRPSQLGEGLTAVIIKSAQPLMINDDFKQRAEELGATSLGAHEQGKAFLGVPILGDEGPIGVLAVQDQSHEGRFAEDDLRLLTTLASQVGLALQSLALLGQARRRAEQLAAAAEVSRAASSILDPDQLMIRAAELIRERFELYYVAIFLLDEERRWAELRYATGEAGRALMERRHRLEVGGQSMVGTAVTTRRARIALDVGKEAVRFANPLLPETHSEMALPLVVGDTTIGALDVQSTLYNAFTADDVTALQTMGDQIAVAIQNARLYLETEQRVQLEQLINRITNKLRRAIDADSIMTVALSELQAVLGARRIVAQLGPEQLLGPIRQTGLLRPIESREREGGNGQPPDNGHQQEG